MGDDRMRLGLIQFGFRIETASSADRGVKRLATTVPQIDAIVVDLSSPGIDLPEIADQLRAVSSGLPIVFLSENTGEFLRDCGLLNIDGIVLQRPFYPSDVAEALYEALGMPNPFGRLRKVAC